MKKIIRSILVIMFLIILSNSCFAISNNFKSIIKISGINRYNNQGYEINEEIYYKYNQIVYGSPELAVNEKTQRWKDVSNGLWNKNETKGEYRILGYNYSGYIVNNHKFPDDAISGVSPIDWNYIEVKNALDSWEDKDLYKFKEQKDYMQNTNLYRNNIMYDINCNKIGLNKARAENYSTIFTKGTIYTNKLDSNNRIWEATFLTDPIDKNIKFDVEIKTTKDEYVIYGNKDYVDIPIKIIGRVSTDSPYITKEYIKLIQNNIYVDSYKVNQIDYKKKYFFKKI